MIILSGGPTQVTAMSGKRREVEREIKRTNRGRAAPKIEKKYVVSSGDIVADRHK